MSLPQGCNNKYANISGIQQPAAAIAVAANQPVPAKDFESVPPTCQCSLEEADTDPEIIYFDKKHVGNITSETIYNTIEFLESFVQEMTATTTTKKPKRKTVNRGKN